MTMTMMDARVRAQFAAYGGINYLSGGYKQQYGIGKGRAINSEIYFDFVHNSVIPPCLINGVFTFAGSQMGFRTQSEQSLTFLMEQGKLQFQQQQQFNMLMGGAGGGNIPQIDTSMQDMNFQGQRSIQQININLIGNKIKPGNTCCVIATIMVGGFFIFPLCFMCCTWWKKIVSPTYELSSQTYRDIGTFIEKNPTANNLNLIIVDSSFNAQKAKIIFDALSRSHIKTFTFLNQALECNGNFNEADDFKANMLPIKSLNITSSIKWGEMIV